MSKDGIEGPNSVLFKTVHDGKKEEVTFPAVTDA